MVAVGGNDMVVVPEQRNGADGDRFLPGVKVKKAPHSPQIVVFQGGLLKAADAVHVPEEPDFLFRGQPGIDFGFGV